MAESDSHKVCAVELDNGEAISADLVVFATGIIPCTPLAKASGLKVQKGICVDAQLKTSDDLIYALGECCEFEGNTYGLVAPIWNQARILAQQLLLAPSDKMPVYTEEAFATKLKVSGIDVHSMGIINPNESEQECEVIEFNDIERSIYKKIITSKQRVIGAVLYGDVVDSQWYFELLQQKRDITEIRKNLIFGQAFCA